MSKVHHLLLLFSVYFVNKVLIVIAFINLSLIAFNPTGAHFTPSMLSGRCMFLSLLILSLLIYNYYTSVLVSTLVQSSSKNKIKTLTDLAESDLDIGFDDIPWSRVYLNVSIAILKHEIK